MWKFITKNFPVGLLGVVFVLGIVGFLHAAPVDYRLGVGDVIHVRVLGEAEFSGHFPIGTDGTIDYPYIRSVAASGETTETLAEKLTNLLKDGYLTRPQVTVAVKEFRSQKVYVLGSVEKPGTYMLKEETRILDILSAAGGITGRGRQKIVLLRAINGKTSPAQSPKAASSLESSKETPPAKVVPEAEKNASQIATVEPKTTVEETKKPENKSETPEMKADAASVEEIVSSASMENRRPIVIDIHRLLSKGDLSQNLVLKDGDVINVPKANEIFVLGFVARPGPLRYEENMTILQAVTLAGGPTPEASPKSTYILRSGKEGAEEKIPVRLDRILDNKASNMLVKANDVIVVPESFF